MIIDTDSLEDDKSGFERILRGYRTALASPNAQGNPELLAELQEGIANNQRDLDNTNAILAAVAKWDGDGTPLHEKEVASQTVINLIKALADELALVPGDFTPKPEILADGGSVNVA